MTAPEALARIRESVAAALELPPAAVGELDAPAPRAGQVTAHATFSYALLEELGVCRAFGVLRQAAMTAYDDLAAHAAGLGATLVEPRPAWKVSTVETAGYPVSWVPERHLVIRASAWAVAA